MPYTKARPYLKIFLVIMIVCICTLSLVVLRRFRKSNSAINQNTSQLESLKTKIEVDIDGVQREYYQFLPEKPQKILLLLHGRFGTGESAFKSLNLDSVDNRTLVIAPNAINRKWYDQRTSEADAKLEIQDQNFLESTLLKYQNTYKINNQNTTILGISNGGLMSQSLICKKPELANHLILVVAPWFAINQNCDLKKKDLQFHYGKKDTLADLDGGITDSEAQLEIMSLDNLVEMLDKNLSCEKPLGNNQNLMSQRTFLSNNCKDGSWSINLYDSGHVQTIGEAKIRF